jgi:protein-S-isoprenylcysteine O-methyltransferase Ste14
MDKTGVRIAGAAIVAAGSLAAISLDQPIRIAICIIVGLPSFVLMVVSRRQLGASFSVRPEAKTLVTSGLYSRIQHPMYLFLDLVLVSVIIAIGSALLLPAWAVIVVAQILQGRREEKVLAAAFGADYEAHRNRTWF